MSYRATYLVSNTVAAYQQRPLSLATLNETHDALILGLVDERTKQRLLGLWVTGRLGPLHKGSFVGFHKLVIDALLDVDPASSEADLSRVQGDGTGAPHDGVLKISVVKDDCRTLPAQLESDALEVGLGGHLLDAAACGRRACEAHLVDLHVASEQCAGATVSREDLEDTRREAGLLDEGSQGESTEGRLFRGLENESVAHR